MTNLRVIAAIACALLLGSCSGTGAEDSVAESDGQPTPITSSPTQDATNASPSPSPTDPASATPTTVSPTPTNPTEGPKPPVPGGDGLPPTISIDPVSFGNVFVDESQGKDVLFKNPDTAGDPDLTIRITGVTFSSSHAPSAYDVEAGTCGGAVLGAGASCTVTVTFRPYAARTFEGTVETRWEYELYAGGGVMTRRVSGTGVPATHPTDSQPPVIGD